MTYPLPISSAQNLNYFLLTYLASRYRFCFLHSPLHLGCYLYIRSHRICSVKKGVLKTVANFTRKQLCWSLFLIKLQAFSPAILLKRDSNAQLFFCEICKISKNTNFKEDIRMDASVGFFYYLFSA